MPQAGDQQSFPLPTQSAREHEADDAQQDAEDERRGPGDDRRDDATAAGVLRSGVGDRNREQSPDQPVDASPEPHAAHAQIVLQTQVPARPQ